MKLLRKIKTDTDNKRFKHLIDDALINITKLLEEDYFNNTHVEKIYNIFNKFCTNLNNIDNNITLVKLETTGQVIVNEILKELSIDKTRFSCNKVKQASLGLIQYLTDESNDLYADAIEAICSIGGICKIYLNNIKPNIAGEDFNTDKKIF